MLLLMASRGWQRSSNEVQSTGVSKTLFQRLPVDGFITCCTCSHCDEVSLFCAFGWRCDAQTSGPSIQRPVAPARNQQQQQHHSRQSPPAQATTIQRCSAAAMSLLRRECLACTAQSRSVLDLLTRKHRATEPDGATATWSAEPITSWCKPCRRCHRQRSVFSARWPNHQKRRRS